ncbi:MAG: HEXXH motif-containing putative peptide modification protein [Bacteriovoracaceae bacterium]
MIFNSTQYKTLKDKLARKYQRDLNHLFTSLKKEDPSFLKSISHYDLHHYSSLNFYLKQQLVILLENIKSTKKLSTDPESFSAEDDNVFERWNDSEFSGEFLQALNKGNSIKDAHLLTIEVLKNHLLVLLERFIHSNDEFHPHYRIQTSLGETGSKKPKRLLRSILNVDEKLIELYAHSLKEFKSFSSRIELALKLIKIYSPSSWDRFYSFTEVIIPINNEEFVSYSHQELPGYSMINLYHRDFIDLLDDLLHENGHHHLNYYLNLSKLIEEPKDLDYFSPWRNSPRPLRGIYHAYFTFFWAYKLFRDLIVNKDVKQDLYAFSKAEWKKIYSRAVEEFHMLNFSFEDLKKAKKKGLIHPEGWVLIEEQQKLLKKDKKLILEWEAKCSKRELSKLKKALEKARYEF